MPPASGLPGLAVHPRNAPDRRFCAHEDPSVVAHPALQITWFGARRRKHRSVTALVLRMRSADVLTRRTWPADVRLLPALRGQIRTHNLSARAIAQCLLELASARQAAPAFWTVYQELSDKRRISADGHD
jgi:hypothetical protein